MIKFIFTILRKFWFPITLFILGRLAKKHEWAAKAHSVGSKLK